MSSPSDNDEAAETGEHQLRSSFVNKSAARKIGDFVRGLWPSAETPESASPTDCDVAVGEELEPEEIPVPEPVEPTDPADVPVPDFLPEPATQPAGPDRFELRVLWAPKAGNDEKEWEDGYAANPGGGVVALADGAGDGIYSKLWADLLLKSFVALPIPLDDPAAVEPWIAAQRRAWFQAIRYPEQRWSIQMKIDRSCGAATFVALVLDQVTESGDDPGAAIGWTAWAVGDACLFHTRGNSLLASFPATSSSEFGTTPFLYQSKPLRATPLAVVTRGELAPDDRIVFATDALAQRLLAEVESGTPPDWDRFWNLDQESWRDELAALREQNAIVNDDCTLLVMRLSTASPAVCDGSEAEETLAPEREISDDDRPSESADEHTPSPEYDHD